MKRYVYVLCLLVSFAGLNSCKKESDPQPEPVVGKWSSDYVLWSGLTGAFAAGNGQKVNPLVYGINDNYEIKADKTFILTDRSGAVITPYPGTWDYTGTVLNLKYDDGDQAKLNYDGSTTTPHLTSDVIAVSDSLTNPTTKKTELVKFSVQLVYSKQ
ncbi:hypothetical protein [Spirosoma areae]